MGFINYPKITYNNVDVSNILFNINIIDKENTPELFLQYYVKDEDTPESVSYKIYEDPTYSWLILSLNNMYNKEYDWPMSSNKFETFLSFVAFLEQKFIINSINLGRSAYFLRIVSFSLTSLESYISIFSGSFS